MRLSDFILFSILLTLTGSCSTLSKTERGKFRRGEEWPSFTAQDVYGKPMNRDSFTGKITLVTFYRNVGCPVCNFHFHYVDTSSEFYANNGVQVVSIYESGTANMKQYLDGQTVYSKMIPDSTEQLYKLFGIRASACKTFKGILFHKSSRKAKEGKSRFAKPMEQDGKKFRMTADFIIGFDGKIIKSYYGQYLGDHLAPGDSRLIIEELIGVPLNK